MTDERISLTCRKNSNSFRNLLDNLSVLCKYKNLLVKASTGEQTLMSQLDAVVYQTLHLTNLIIRHFLLPSSGALYFFFNSTKRSLSKTSIFSVPKPLAIRTAGQLLLS